MKMCMKSWYKCTILTSHRPVLRPFRHVICSCLSLNGPTFDRLTLSCNCLCGDCHFFHWHPKSIVFWPLTWLWPQSFNSVLICRQINFLYWNTWRGQWTLVPFGLEAAGIPFKLLWTWMSVCLHPCVCECKNRAAETHFSLQDLLNDPPGFNP